MKLKKKPVSIRISQHLLDAVKATGEPLTEAVEEGLMLWLRRRAEHAAKRRSSKKR